MKSVRSAGAGQRAGALVLAEFAAPSHFVSSEHLRDAADNVAAWTDHRSGPIVGALRLASRRDVRPSVIELLRAAASMSSGLRLAHAS